MNRSSNTPNARQAFVLSEDFISDFPKFGNMLSDYYGLFGKLVIAGTASLNIRLVMADKLYDNQLSYEEV
ncbi:MAG: hypothetical protein LUE87_11990 [Lachnospiraceae bacterium]|nr:hypothetical protein [Lachnospiraceae bacterium]